MLPAYGKDRSKGTGRGRGRGRNRDSQEQCIPGRQQFFQNPTEQEQLRGTNFEIEQGEHSQYHLLGSNDQKSKQAVVSDEALSFQMKRKLAIMPTLPARPGEGTLGKRIKLISNCFPVKVPSGNIYHYDVTVRKKARNQESEANTMADQNQKKYRCLSTKQNRKVMALILDTNPAFNNLYAAYDGQKNLYTRHPLHVDFPIRCEIILPDDNPNPEYAGGSRQDVFQVEIKPVIKKETESCRINLDTIHALFEKRSTSVPQEAVMALETILRHGPCFRFIPIGRSFFYPPNPGNMHPLGGGLEIWFGYHQSIRLGQWGPMVNLDLTATTFYQKGPVLNYIADFINTNVQELRRRPCLPNMVIRKISNKLNNMRIEVTHLRAYRRKFRILRLSKESANRLEFELTENGRTVKKTVAAYFRDRYNRILEFPNLPCLQVYPENKKTYLPIEVCEFVEGQHCKSKLDNRQTAEMIKFTALPPQDRFLEIKKIVNTADINRDESVQGFNLEVSDKPLRLEGRVLDSPSIQYKGSVIKPKEGSWNMRQVQFFRGAIIKSWVLLSLADLDRNSLNRFSALLVKVGKETGMSIDYPDLIDIVKCDDFKELLLNMKAKYKAGLVVIVLPPNDKTSYCKIKQAADTIIGLTTQCVKEINVTNPKKCTPQLITNLCQKINSKMGGENNSLLHCEIPAIFKNPVIIIGADVNHPALSRGIKPSLAACVGSLDINLSRYAVSIKAQDNIDENKQAVEIIQDLKSMIVDLLRAFYHHTRQKPEKIIFYRDGVSEGQFEKVQDHEVRSVRQACRHLEDDYQPGITFIVVQKRHHTRFMPQDPRDGVGNMKNIPPGTTVDTVVTHPENFDFFLCSHFGLKGTSRPGHYTVLEDDNDFTANDLQKLSYQLCHTYARCTRSISIPVPVAYADLAAFRARVHLEAADSTYSSDSSSSEVLPLSQSVIDSIKVIKGLENAMYFV